MNVAKWLLLLLLLLPLAELAAFIAVAATYGFLTALGLIFAGTLTGVVVLRQAGSNHMARVRVAMNQGFERSQFTALAADGTAGLMLLAGILLVIPGFITDVLGLAVLAGTAWRRLSGPGAGQRPQSPDGVVDLEPEQWHRVDDLSLPPRQAGRDRNEQRHEDR